VNGVACTKWSRTAITLVNVLSKPFPKGTERRYEVAAIPATDNENVPIIQTPNTKRFVFCNTV